MEKRIQDGTYTRIPGEYLQSPRHWEAEAIRAYLEDDPQSAQAAAAIASCQRLDELRQTLQDAALPDLDESWRITEGPDPESDVSAAAGQVH